MQQTKHEHKSLDDPYTILQRVRTYTWPSYARAPKHKRWGGIAFPSNKPELRAVKSLFYGRAERNKQRDVTT